MRFGKLFLCFFTLLFLLGAVFAGQKEQEPDGFLSVDVTYGNRTENIASWELSDDYILYLPGSADLEQMQLRFSGDSSWAIDGIPLEDRTPCEEFLLNHVYELTCDGEHVGTVQLQRSANVGAMFVETASGNMEHIHAAKGNEEAGKLRLYTQTGELNHDGVISAINGRGNSTWNEEKKSYSVELASEADLLNMGSAGKWILLSNIYDITNLRNKVVYDFARDFDLAYSPESDWVDLYLNGEYAGLYLLCERNEVHSQRVDISRNDSFLVSRDAYWRFDEQGKPYITTQSKAALRIYHAGMSADEMLAIWQSAENAILSEDGVDSLTGKTWQELIDLESWVRKYLVDEVFGNRDGTALSQFYYYDKSEGDQKIYAGPVWDYDLSMCFDSEDHQSSIQRFYANVPNIYGAHWPDALYRKPEYYAEILRLYETEFLPLLNSYFETVIPQYSSRIAQASAMNASRWGMGLEAADPVEIFEYLAMRTVFLDDIWLHSGEYCMVNATDATGSTYYYAVKPGDPLPTKLRNKSADGNYTYNWYDLDNGDIVLAEEPVYTDRNIHLRYEPVAAAEQTTPDEAGQTLTNPVEGIPTQEQEESSPVIELPPLRRILPVILFVLMLLGVIFAGMYQLYADRRKKKNKTV